MNTNDPYDLLQNVTTKAETLGYAKAKLEVMEIIANVEYVDANLIIELMAWLKK